MVVAIGDARPLLRRLGGHPNRFNVARVISPETEDVEQVLMATLLPSVLETNSIWGIVVVPDNESKIPADLLLKCKLKGIRVFDDHSFYEQVFCYIDIDARDPRWLWSPDGFRGSRSKVLIKRVLDLLIAVSVSILALPLMLIIAALIRIDSRGPVLYSQERVGLNGRAFIVYKFRSMTVDAEAEGIPKWASHGDPRITRVGRFIRYTRIDELPQVINVLLGQMSIIGPRPERPYFVKQLAAEIPLYSSRHSIRPGITGWAQVNAPYGASFEDARQKLRYDLYYIKNCNVWLDLRILLRTLRVVIFQEGAR